MGSQTHFNFFGSLFIYRGIRYTKIKHKSNNGDSPLSYSGGFLFSLITEIILRILPWWITSIIWILFGIGFVLVGVYIKV